MSDLSPHADRQEPVEQYEHRITCRAPRCFFLVREKDGADVCRAPRVRAFQPEYRVNEYVPGRLLPPPDYWCGDHPAIRRLVRRLAREDEQ